MQPPSWLSPQASERDQGVLLRRGQLAVQRRDEQVRLRRNLRARALRATNRGRARKEDENVALKTLRDEAAHRRFDLKLKRAFVVPRLRLW